MRCVFLCLVKKKLFSWILKSCLIQKLQSRGPRRAVRLDFRKGEILCLHRSGEAWISVLSRMGFRDSILGEVRRVEPTSCLATNTCSCLTQKLHPRTTRRHSFSGLAQCFRCVQPPVKVACTVSRQTLAVACIKPWISNLLLGTRIRNFLFVLVRRVSVLGQIDDFSQLSMLPPISRQAFAVVCALELVSSVHDGLHTPPSQCTSPGQFEPCALGGNRTSEHCHCPSSFLRSCLWCGSGACLCTQTHMRHAGAILPSVPECQFHRL